MRWKVWRQAAVQKYTKHSSLQLQTRRKISTERWNNMQARGSSGSTHSLINVTLMMEFMSSENIQLGIKFSVFLVSMCVCVCEPVIKTKASGQICFTILSVCFFSFLMFMHHSHGCFTWLFTHQRWNNKVKCEAQMKKADEIHVGTWQTHSCSWKHRASAQQTDVMEVIQSRTGMIQLNDFMSAAHSRALTSRMGCLNQHKGCVGNIQSWMHKCCRQPGVAQRGWTQLEATRPNRTTAQHDTIEQNCSWQHLLVLRCCPRCASHSLP